MTRSHATTTLVAALAGLTIVMAVPAGSASAKPLERGSFHDEFSNVLEDYCDVPGLDVRNEGTIDARFLVLARGAAKTPYFMQHGVLRQVLTNEATGESVSVLVRTLEKDLRVTDNGDGTFTILVLATGNATIYDGNGKAIARNPGQVRYEILIDNGGTPADPSDDEFLDFLGFVKESTGRSDDACAASVQALR